MKERTIITAFVLLALACLAFLLLSCTTQKQYIPDDVGHVVRDPLTVNDTWLILEHQADGSGKWVGSVTYPRDFPLERDDSYIHTDDKYFPDEKQCEHFYINQAQPFDKPSTRNEEYVPCICVFCHEVSVCHNDTYMPYLGTVIVETGTSKDTCSHPFVISTLINCYDSPCNTCTCMDCGKSWNCK